MGMGRAVRPWRWVGFVALALLVAFTPVGVRGWYFCVVCGAEERQFSVAGLTMARRAAGTTSRYLRWYEQHIHEQHVHDWSPRGFFFSAFGLPPICMLLQAFGGTLGDVVAETSVCRPLGFADAFSGPAVVYLNGLPRFPEQVLAERLARWIVHASAEDRRRLAEAVDIDAPGPCLAENKALWEPLSRDKSEKPDAPSFRIAFHAWAACHPEMGLEALAGQ